MSDKSDLLAELVAADAKIIEQAEEIERLEKEVAWQPVETMPSAGRFLVGVWEFDWNESRRDWEPSFHAFEATGSPWGPSWHRYDLSHFVVGWMPIPKPPAVEGEP